MSVVVTSEGIGPRRECLHCASARIGAVLRQSLPVAALFALVASVGTSGRPQAPNPNTRALETALDRYVAAPDASFRFEVAATLPADGATVTLLDLTSQQWLTGAEVDEPVWRHWLTVIRPQVVSSETALLFITGGSRTRPRPTAPSADLLRIARATNTVVAELRMVPNQPIVFRDDPAKKERVEDDFIAYTWNKFLETGEVRWPAQFPMTKSAVRAMDAVSAFTASPAGGSATVSRFVVSGASKRGWTTWTTAAVDRRVVAIAPLVIDLLNVEPSFIHHWRAYGFWAPSVKDYVDHGIMEWRGTPQFRALMRLVEPFEYRARLTMPKLLINASGDQFFLPDSSQFYVRDLPGETVLRYVPNADHSLEKSDASQTLEAFYSSVVRNVRRPSFTWTFGDDGSIRVVSKDLPRTVTLWQAVNPSARDFRVETIGAAYQPTPLTLVGPNTWSARISAPARGWVAGFVELTFDVGGQPLKMTTGVRVLPDRLPFEAPVAKRAVGQ
jgi:PhoPQ-activated pathogenicity-related protein